jgi:hypothetical protein
MFASLAANAISKTKIKKAGLGHASLQSGQDQSDDFRDRLEEELPSSVACREVRC